ncbi:Endonuclease/exonuclease/phosphatase [Aspergillus californicus]
MSCNDEQPTGPRVGDYPSDSDSFEATDTDSSSLSYAVKARKEEYTRHRSVHVKVGTWNVAAIAGTEKDIGRWFVQRKGVYEQVLGSQGGSGFQVPNSRGAVSLLEIPPDQVGLYVLGLQEIVDVSSPAEALRPYVDPGPAKKWKAAVEDSLPPGYKLIAEVQLTGLLQLVYAAPSIADSVSSVSCSSVGTGLLGYMGNKGAVATRLLLGETTCLIFVNCHLAAGSDKTSLDRRNWDASQVVGRMKFDSINPEHTLRAGPSDIIGDEDYAFWFGDLNYRLEDIPGNDVRQVLARHTENEYDKSHRSLVKVNGTPSSPHVIIDEGSESRSSSPETDLSSKTRSVVLDEDRDPHQDPASLETTISSLFPHDQLRIQQSKHKAFHDGWREGQISFLPTYKYDVGSIAKFDSSEKHRGPSWCDRILYRSRREKIRYEREVKDASEAKKRDEEMKASGLENAAADDNVLFDYDPDVDGDSGEEYDPNDEAGEDASPDAALETDDSIRLDYYLSHQGILSSDHKPLVAGFTLELECVEPKLKAQVHQEVVRELDKAENESRPVLTVVVDNHNHESSDQRSQRDPNAVEFGNISFDVPVSRSLTVANTGGVSATFSFQKPERGNDSGASFWLEYRVEKPHHDGSGSRNEETLPDECTLLPGDLAGVEIIIWVRNIQLVRLLNSGQIKLEEILVLRVKDGRDHFIFAQGAWLPTAFGRTIEELTLIPETGARSLASSTESQKAKQGAPISAPRELFRLTDAVSELTERAVAEWDMVERESDDKAPWEKEPHGCAWPFDPETWTLKDKEVRSTLLASAREAVDTNGAISQIFTPEVSSLHRLEVLSEILVSFLRSLKDGVISAAVWNKFDQQIQARDKAKRTLSWEDSQAWVLESLAYSPAHSVSFTFVTFMLARVANEIAPVPSIPLRGAGLALEESTKEMARRRQAVERALATVFSSVLISTDVPIPSKDKEKRVLEERKRSVIEPFLKAIGVDNHGPSGGAP